MLFRSVTEKGQFSLSLSVHSLGGHASVPPRHTGIGILALLVVELEKNRGPIKLEGTPYLEYLTCAADFGDVPWELESKIRNPRKWKELGDELAKDDDTLAAYLGTTQAVDIISAGVKVCKRACVESQR